MTYFFERVYKTIEMKQIWAPWRIKYILDSSKKNGCIFCEKIKEKKDKKNYILYRGKTCFIIMNLFPYNSGHLMIAPYKHTSELEDLVEEELLEIMQLTKKSLNILKKSLSPDGFNLGINLGKIAGAGIDTHLHLHIVPRWSGDTNFMPVISSTKVISESLDDTYRRLKKEIKKRKLGE